MNREEKLIVGLLFALLLVWGIANRGNFAPHPQPPRAAAAGTNAPAAIEEPAADLTNAVERAAAPAASNGAPVMASWAAVPAGTNAVTSAAPAARTVWLSNDLVRIEVSARGGGITLAELCAYRATVKTNSGPVQLAFAAMPALSLAGIPGLEASQELDVSASADGSNAMVRGRTADGIEFTRTLRLADRYRILVEDTFANPGAEARVLPAHRLAVGPMHMNAGETTMRGLTYLGLDTLGSQGGSRVIHWGKTMNTLFGVKSRGFACAGPDLRDVPEMAEYATRTTKDDFGTDWVAVKNKYFVQILEPDDSADGCRLLAARDPAQRGLAVRTVAAQMEFAGRTLAPGQHWTRTATYYLGPKKYTILKTLGKFQSDIMQFAWQSSMWDWFRWICAGLLWTLNAIHGVIPSYGVAIILVTVLVRMIFWPITAKSTASMKKMQSIQPLVTEIRTKFKDNPQKMNQAIMELYREHHVNPMSGCLPMVVQIPVFIALYTVLRSAIELRFAPFLWIHDLSEPENLLAGVLPMPLSILPLVMTATTLVQQRLTPSAGDPAQQKMMMMMPIMFLFFFYSMPSALVLYWTVSQGLAIVQLLRQRRHPVAIGSSAPPRAKRSIPSGMMGTVYRGAKPKGRR